MHAATSDHATLHQPKTKHNFMYMAQSTSQYLLVLCSAGFGYDAVAVLQAPPQQHLRRRLAQPLCHLVHHVFLQLSLR